MLLSLILGLMPVLVSCSDDDKDCGQLPQIFIEQPYYSMAKGQVEIKVGADEAPDHDVAIPV